ncbi:MAG TPA: hypothetical protein VNN76_09625 [Bacteroidota bacterium]|nr:hypothetical protein [Bacteroidota bacterium]
MSNGLRLRWPKRVDWKWVGVGFCFYVVFHLLPTYLLLGISLRGMHTGFASFAIWMFTGLAVIGFYIGYRSSGVTIVEPGLSALLYILALVLGTQRLISGSVSLLSFFEALSWMGAAFVIAIASAFVGELLQARKEESEGS